MDDALIAETVRYVAIRRLQSAYADVATRRAWGELDGLFLPDAVVEVDKRSGDPLRLVGPHALGEFIGSAIAGFSFFEFVILNTRVEIGVGGDADAAAGRMYICELRKEEASGRFTQAFGVYHDRYRYAGGHWWFEHRRYHSLARTGADLEDFGFPHHLRLDAL
jgi:hypothetical protein